MISPGVILIPSNMIILKEKLAGYNNVLTLATGGMRFGTNVGVNRMVVKPAPLMPGRLLTATDPPASEFAGSARSGEAKTDPSASVIAVGEPLVVKEVALPKLSTAVNAGQLKPVLQALP